MLTDLSPFGYIAYTLIVTHLTIVSVTLFLHRHQAHRALELHPIASHGFRFWLWLTTGMVTAEWVAVHRKHHARVETEGDPHSPQVHGINRVMWLGAWLYRKAATDPLTLQKYAHGTPDDWIERNLYRRFPTLGPVCMVIIDLFLFGWIGLMIWVVQMAWIPFWAAGVINGVGHWFGYRNFEVKDASRNIFPWGIIIGGEELHNNHHAYASSARFSTRRFELDIGWHYLQLLVALKLARVNKSIPRFQIVPNKELCDLDTLQAVLGNRIQVMADFASRVLKTTYREELRSSIDARSRQLLGNLDQLLRRDFPLCSKEQHQILKKSLHSFPRLQLVYDMKLALQEIWSNHSQTPEVLVKRLNEWCHRAEQSGVRALEDFSRHLRGYQLAPTH